MKAIRAVALAGVLGALCACTGDPDRQRFIVPTDPGPLSLTSVSPTLFPEGEQLNIGVTGTGFKTGASVFVGGQAVAVEVRSSTFISAKVPARAPGVVDVVVTLSSGESARLAAAVSFVPFEISTATRSRALAGETLFVGGSGFHSGVRCTVDGLFAGATDIRQDRLGIILPSHGAGLVDITITQPSGASRTLSGVFTYDNVSLAPNKMSIAPGESISVSWVAPSGRAATDWIGLYRVGAEDEVYIDYRYTNGDATGQVTFTAPFAAGQYEFRYLVNDGYISSGKSPAFTIRSSSP